MLWLSRRIGTYAKFSLQTLKHGYNLMNFLLLFLSFNLIYFVGSFIAEFSRYGLFYVEEPFVPVLVLEFIHRHIFAVGAVFVIHLLKRKLLVCF